MSRELTEQDIINEVSISSVITEAPELDISEVESNKLEAIKRGFIRENDVLSLTEPLKDNMRTNPEYNGMEKLIGTKYEPFIEAAMYADNDDELNRVLKQIDYEIDSNKIIEENPWSGLFGEIVGGLVSPTTLIPASGYLKAASKIATMSRTALAGAATGAGIIGTQEFILQQNQLVRSAEESVANTIAGAVGGSIFGAAAGALLGRTEKEAAEELIKDALTKGEIKLAYKEDGNIDFDRSMGAASVDLIKQRTAEGLANISEKAVNMLSLKSIGLAGPHIRTLTSKSPTVRRLGNNSFKGGGFTLNKNLEGVRTDDSMEGLLSEFNAKVVGMNVELEKAYAEYAGLAGKSFQKLRSVYGQITKKIPSYEEFSSKVADGLRKGQSDIPEVQKAINILRPETIRIAKELQEIGILSKEISDEDMVKYLSRRWLVDKIHQDRRGFEKKLAGYFESRGVDSDQAGLSAVKATDNILGLGDDQLEMTSIIKDIVRTKTGKFTKSRVLGQGDPEFDNIFREYINQDGLANALSYITQGQTLIEFRKMLDRLGYESVADLKRTVADELTELARIEKLSKDQVDAEMSLVDDVMAINLGQFGLTRNGDEVLRVLRKYQVLTLLGGVTISSMPDLAMPVFKHGLGSTFKDGWLPLVRNLKEAKLSRDQLKDAAVGLELETNETLRAIVDPTFSLNKSKSRLENYMDIGTDQFSKLTLMSYWNNFNKRLAGHMSAARTLRSIKNYQSLSKKEKTRLASLGIDERLANKIKAEAEKYSREVDGSFIPNQKSWRDDEARRAFNQSVLKDVESTIITPGRGDIPLIVQKSELAKTIFQFKSFTAAATNKILISGLQRKDKETLQGIVMLITMGGIVNEIKAQLAGREGAKDADDFIREGIARSGVAGLIGDVAFTTLPGLNSSRFAALNTKDALLGPTISQATSIPELLNRVSDGDLSDEDRAKMKRFIPFQNLFYINGLFSQVNGK